MMKLEILNGISIHEEIKTEGHSPLRILAHNFVDYIVKNDKGFQPPFGIINEIVANQFLQKWNIPTPNMALMYVDEDLINSVALSNKHKFVCYREYPSFASEYLNHAVEVSAIILNNDKETFNKILNPLDIFHITLFDTWVENEDRKPTNYNLLLQAENEKFKLYAIDNASIFSCVNYDELTYIKPNVSSNDHLLVSELGAIAKKHMQIDELLIKKERTYFYFCISEIEKIFDELLNEITQYYKIDKNTINTFKAFLFNKERNKLVFEEYIYRLKP